MPVGGGHHGGGGHHSGGHHHGGGGHHHGGGGHHHGGGYHHGGHQHHYYGHNRYYAQRHIGPLYYSPFRWFYRGIILLVSVIVLGFVLLVIGMAQFFSGPSVNSVVASPQDDRRLSYSQGSCGSIDLSSSQGRYPVLLYLLSQPPGTTDGDSFQLTNSWYLYRGNYRYYNFYLLKGSTASLSLYVASRSVNVMILTKSQFKKFDKDEYHSSELSDTCTSTQPSSPCQYSYDVSTDDEYYFLFYAQYYSDTVQNTLDIQKKIFVIDPTSIFSNCTASCSLSVPSSPSLYPVVRTGDPPGSGSWTDEVSYSWKCSSAFAIHTWVYLLVITGVIVMLISVAITVATVLILYFKKKNANTAPVERAPLVTEAPPPSAPSGSFMPPPANPNIGAPPAYGWVEKN